MEMDVVFESVLEIGSSPMSSSGKDWKARLCVLKRHGDTKRSTLDYYKDTRKRWQKQVPKGVVSLWPWFTISLAHNSPYKYPMKLMTPEHTVYLSANSFQLMNQWFYHIQTQKIIEAPKRGSYTFSVQVQDSESMNIIGANGDCLLVLTTDMDIQCALLPSKKVVCVWPFECLRRYWCGDGLFGFECGRRAPHGEGRYVFITNQDEKLYKRLEKFIDKAKRGSVFSTSSSEASLVDDRPPAPLPSEARHSETPPVKSSESDDDPENPPLPPKPPHTMQQMPLPSDVSTNPAYVVRTHPSAGATASGHQWLHESFESPEGLRRGSRTSEQPNPHAQPPTQLFNAEAIQTRDPLEENMYSHTVHPVPAPFQLQRDHSTVVGESTYNALVHQKGPRASPKEKKNPSEDDLYDVAYPDANSRQIIQADTEEDEYSKPSFDTPDGHIPRTKMPLSKMPLGKPEIQRVMQQHSLDAAAPLSASLQSEDGMTRNPLYGSQNDLLDALESLEGQITKEIERPSAVSPIASDVLLQSQAALNPTYGQVTLAAADGNAVADSIAATADTEEGNNEQPDNDRAKTTQENGTNDTETDSPRGKNAEGCTSPSIERDSKGYSKVDKNKKIKQNDCPDVESAPDPEDLAPPIPERLYSSDSNDAIANDV